MITIKRLLAFLFCWAYLLCGFGQTLRFSHLTPKDGLSHSSVNSIIKDKRGLMWFASEDGLNRYDGYDFRTYRYEPNDSLGLSHNFVRSILQDSRGNIWVGTNYGLNRYDEKNDKFDWYFYQPKTLKKGANENTINSFTAIYEDNQHRLWFGLASGGLAQFDYEQDKIISYDVQNEATMNLASLEILCFYQDAQNRLWFGTKGSGLFRLDLQKNTLTTFKSNVSDKTALQNNFVYAIDADAEGNLWIGTDGGGLHQFSPKTEQVIALYQFDNEKDSSLGSNLIRAVRFDKQGKLWVGTDGGGLNLFQPENQTFIRYKKIAYDDKSLNTDVIRSIFEDSEGRKWLGTFAGGVNYFEDAHQGFVHLKHTELIGKGLNHPSVLSVLKRKNGEIWLGTDGGGINIYQENQPIVYLQNDPKNPRSLSANAVLCMLEDTKGRLWVGTYAGGLNLYDEKTKSFIHFTHKTNNPNSLIGKSVWSLAEDQTGKIWIGCSAGISVYNPKDDTFKNYQHDPNNPKSLSGYDVRSVICDSQGRIWIGNFSGVNLYLPEIDGFQKYNTEIGKLSRNEVVSIFEISKGKMAFGTYGGGLNMLDEKSQKITVFRKKDGLPNDIIYGMLRDADGYIWLSTNMGLSRYDTENQKFKNYIFRDGLQGTQFNLESCYWDKETGKMYFGGTNGLNIFDPKDLRDNMFVPPVIISNLFILNKLITPNNNQALTQNILMTDEVTLTHTDYMFTLEFSALSYRNSQRNQYRYKLEGFDADWTEAGTHRRATYTNIPAGNYTFLVQGSNDDGIWNMEGKKLNINILPAWWQTKLFRVSGLVFITFLVVFMIWRREQTLKKDREILEQKVNVRTQELQQSKQEITVQNEELRQQQEEIMAQRAYIEDKNQLLESQNQRLTSNEDIIKKAYESLQKKQQEVEKINETLHLQHTKITDSIRYAQTIQRAVLPTQGQLQLLYKNHFVIYQPKDIVAGDFYWVGQFHNQIFTAVVDCTGHGVPGAFMSMIASASLNHIVLEKHIFDPAQTLERLNVRIQNALKQSQTDNRDGMDLCLCKIQPLDKQNYELTYCGAKRPLYYVQNGIFHEIKGSRKSIGGLQIEGRVFENHQVSLQTGAILYLTTDGYIDQNDPARHKFGRLRFHKLLERISQMPFESQKQKLETELTEHQQDEEQRDDITILGLML